MPVGESSSVLMKKSLKKVHAIDGSHSSLVLLAYNYFPRGCIKKRCVRVSTVPDIRHQVGETEEAVRLRMLCNRSFL